METNFESCCRLCLADNRNLNDVFRVNSENQVQLADMVREVCSIEVYKNDTLPKEICSECVEIVIAAYKLRLTSLKNDRIMRGYDFAIKEEADDLIKYEPSPSPAPYENFTFEIAEEEDIVEESYHCDQCPEVRTSKFDLEHHIRHEHLHICSVCSKRYNSLSSLKIHFQRVHFKEKLPCELCKMTFSSRKKLEMHEEIHLNFDETTNGELTSYECIAENCKKVFDSYTDKMIDHIKYHKKRSKEKQTVKRRNSTDESLVCPHCGQLYKSKQILQQHIKRHFDSGDRYSCPKCPQKFKSW